MEARRFANGVPYSSSREVVIVRGQEISRKIYLRIPAVLLVVVLVSGCRPADGGDGTETQSPQAFSGKLNVYLQDGKFNPDRLTITAGSTVIWINQEPVLHTVHSDSDLFHSNLLAVGQVFSYTFDEPGAYPYYCDTHGGPGGEGMSGVITVVP